MSKFSVFLFEQDKFMKKPATFLLMLFIVFLISTCKKDNPVPPPEINVLLPLTNAQYNVYDTVKIKLIIDSEQPEVSLKISLLKANYSPASPINPLVFPNFKTGTETTLDFLLDDEYLESDNYSLHFKATDHSGSTTVYRSIYIEGIQRQFEGIFIVSELSTTQTGIEKLGTNFTGHGIKIMTGNYAGSAVNSRNKLVYVAGRNSGNLIAMDTDSLTKKWEVPIIPNPVQPYFTCLEQIDQVLYVGFYSGEVNGYNPSGNLIFSTQADGLTFPVRVCIAGNTLVVSSTSKSNLFEDWLETFFLISGASNSKTKLLIKPVYLKTLGDEEVLVFGNADNSKAGTKLFDPETGLVTDPYQPFALPDELLICAAGINQNLTLLSLESGIYLYDDQSSISLVAESISPQILRWEEISQTIMAADAEEIFVLSANGQLISEHNYPEPILNLLIHYNK
jgi:hypothetical protein